MLLESAALTIVTTHTKLYSPVHTGDYSRRIRRQIVADYSRQYGQGL